MKMVPSFKLRIKIFKNILKIANILYGCPSVPLNHNLFLIFISEQDLKPEFRLKVAEWEVRKALAGTSKKNVDEIRQLMPDDFNKKLKEWELKKQTPTVAANVG